MYLSGGFTKTPPTLLLLSWLSSAISPWLRVFTYCLHTQTHGSSSCLPLKPSRSWPPSRARSSRSWSKPSDLHTDTGTGETQLVSAKLLPRRWVQLLGLTVSDSGETLLSSREVTGPDLPLQSCIFPSLQHAPSSALLRAVGNSTASDVRLCSRLLKINYGCQQAFFSCHP